MIILIGTLALIFCLLVTTQILWKTKRLKGENARKFVHISVGIFGATWPFYLDWTYIQIICLIATLFAIFMRVTKIFQSVYDVKRNTYGDIIGPVTFGLVALMKPDPWIFVAVVLYVALADGLAAVVGTRFGKNNSYKVLGYTKSVAGTVTFFLTALIITIWIMEFSPLHFSVSSWPIIILLPLSTALAENIGVYGIDNFLIGVLTVSTLSHFQVIL